ncbi:Hypothetical protein FKW44_014952 [Caligus rogercresseyi]|uniref:Uncharacterized protein n=1 Tax=Caligus rogercresseyi TaxID=217165 RepID=A0A7T8GZM3_CALRO|nr:Hypothetical protein FKW44_014952 [Caligus rogercresseyi]
MLFSKRRKCKDTSLYLNGAKIEGVRTLGGERVSVSPTKGCHKEESYRPLHGTLISKKL